MTEIQETMTDSAVLRPTVLRVEKVSGADPYERKVESLSFEIAEKGVHAILGPKGSGKTLLMDLLSGSEWAGDGRILFGEQELTPEAWELKKKIGYVQQRCPFDGTQTVTEVLDFVGEARGVVPEKRYRQIKEALDLTGLEACRNRLVKRLTAEEEKRLGLAAALLGNPDVLLLDEPIPAVRADARQEFFELIRMLGRIKTVLLATADFEVARSLCEDVVILSDGKLLAKGGFEELDAKLKAGGESESLEQIYRMLAAAAATPKTFSEESAKESSEKRAENEEKEETE